MAKKVLVMDDDASILCVLEEALSYENFHVKITLESTSVLKTVEDFSPDVILLDYVMNGVNGGEICHQIKCNPATEHIPVIIMSAYPKVFMSLGTYGCDSFIAKPFDLFQLIETIDSVLTYRPRIKLCI